MAERLPQRIKSSTEQTSTNASAEREATTDTLAASHMKAYIVMVSPAENAPASGGKLAEDYQGEERQKRMTDEEIVVQPQKVENLEADEYLLSKAIKAQENAIEKVKRAKIRQLQDARRREHNAIVKKRKQERQNKRKARK